MITKESFYALCMDIKATINAMENNLDEVMRFERGWKKKSLKVRHESVALEKLFKEYRRQRVIVAAIGTKQERWQQAIRKDCKEN